MLLVIIPQLRLLLKAKNDWTIEKTQQMDEGFEAYLFVDYSDLMLVTVNVFCCYTYVVLNVNVKERTYM